MLPSSPSPPHLTPPHPARILYDIELPIKHSTSLTRCPSSGRGCAGSDAWKILGGHWSTKGCLFSNMKCGHPPSSTLPRAEGSRIISLLALREARIPPPPLNCCETSVSLVALPQYPNVGRYHNHCSPQTPRIALGPVAVNLVSMNVGHPAGS